MPPEKKSQQEESFTDIARLAEKQLIKAAPGAEHKDPQKTYTPNPELKTLRTFQGDMEETIHKKNESVVTIATAEQNKKKNPVPELVSTSKGSFFLTHGILPLAGIILVLTGAVTLALIFYYRSVNNTPVSVPQKEHIIVSAEKVDIPVTDNMRDDITQGLIQNKISLRKPLDTTIYTKFLKNKQEISSTDFFQAIAPSAPATLTRSFEGLYMSGIYSFDTNEIFIILSTNDFGQTYAGMLKWENTLYLDLAELFPSSLDKTKAPLFNDDSFNNRDVRTLKDQNGKIVLLYGFVDKNTLIITTNERIFQSLASKYINSKLVR